MTEALLQTPLYSWHRSHGARLVEFAGWSMPIQYSSIVEEHNATRSAVGLFDISHMGRLEFLGGDALAFLDRLTTRRVANLKPGAIRYSLITNEQGGILDDVLVYHLSRLDGTPQVMMVVNASNRDKIVRWLEHHRREADSVTVVDRTLDTAMIAVQGPAAIRLIDPMVEADLDSMKYYSGTITKCEGVEVVVSRTGYTGEDGCELTVPAAAAMKIWSQIAEQGRATGTLPVGLAARDTLRLEAAMPLYGHELSEQIDPYQAGLHFAVQLKDREFLGRTALVAAKDNQDSPVRVGLQMQDRRVPREHYKLSSQGRVIGEVTSGTFSPTLQRPIAMAYVPRELSQSGTSVDVDIRGRWATADIVDLPFYSRKS